MISFACSACSKPLTVQDEVAGKRVKCPGCGKAVVAPANGQAAPEQPSPGTLPPRPPVASDSDASHTMPWPVGEPSSAMASAQEKDANANTRAHYDFLAPAEQPDEIGRLGGFRVLSVLGAGAMGVVFQAEDPKLKRKLAIKAMLPSLAPGDTVKQRFLREAQTAAAIEHDHIVPILQVGEDRGVPFIAMPFLKGESLEDRLKRNGALPMGEVVRIGREAAEGLAAAHAVGLIHRDIKPANLWLEAPKGRVKILDFGLARATTDNTQLTQHGAIVGTPAYMSPEQGAGEALDARCDLFSLGCVLYRLATGQAPFKGANTASVLMSVASVKPPAPAEVNPAVPAALSDLVMHLLAKKPAERPESARVVAAALEDIEVHAGDGTARPRTKTRQGKESSTASMAATHMQLAGRAKKRLPVGWLMVGGVLCLIVVGLSAFLLSRPSDNTANRGNQNGSTGIKQPEALPATFTNDLGMEFVLVPKGKSWLGGGGGKPGDKEVEIKEDFYLGKYEVTQEEWTKVLGAMPSHFSRTGDGAANVKAIYDVDLKRFPVETVSWDDTQLFFGQLNKQDKQEGWMYRLPKEAEWEYACRGGPMSDKLDSAFDFYFDKPVEQLQPEQANFGRLRRTCKVGSYQPNKLGLYDMHGNVWEWCDDEEKVDNGASLRVGRGGGWDAGSGGCRAAARHAPAPNLRSGDLGLRVARVPVGKDVVAPPPESAKDPDRRAAEYVLSIGGTVRVKGDDRDIKAAVELPREKFQLGEVFIRDNAQVTDAGLASFKGCRGITLLDLTRTNVSDAGMDNFRDCKELRSLGLFGTKVTDIGLANFKDCKDLLNLNLHVEQVGDAGLASFKVCKNLAYLEIAGTKVTEAGLAHFKECKNLQELVLFSFPVTDAGLANFKDCKKLWRLWLSNPGLTDTGLANFKDCKGLRSLQLHCGKVTAQGLAVFKDCTELNDLDLANITAAAEPGLAHFENCKKLAQLNLKFPLSDAGLSHFRGIKNLTTLQLAHTNVTQAGFASLKDFKGLSTLLLEGANVNDACLVKLKDCKSLTALNLNGTSVTVGGVAELSKALPRCKINWDGKVIEGAKAP